MPLPTNLSELEEIFELLADMNVIQNHISAHFNKVVPHNLSIAQFSILHYFYARPGAKVTMNVLVDHFSLSKASVGDSIEKLCKKEFVLVERNEEDNRSKLVSITEGGLTAHSDALAAIRPFLSDLKEGVGSNTFTRAIRLLSPLRDWLRQNK